MNTLACGHVRTEDARVVSNTAHADKCSCCQAEVAKAREASNFRLMCHDCHDGSEVTRLTHVSFRNDVVMASSVGVCMFCSDPHASMMFRGDESVRICERCVQ